VQARPQFWRTRTCSGQDCRMRRKWSCGEDDGLAWHVPRRGLDGVPPRSQTSIGIIFLLSILWHQLCGLQTACTPPYRVLFSRKPVRSNCYQKQRWLTAAMLSAKLEAVVSYIPAYLNVGKNRVVHYLYLLHAIIDHSCASCAHPVEQIYHATAVHKTSFAGRPTYEPT